jgi:hypothetical protein
MRLPFLIAVASLALAAPAAASRLCGNTLTDGRVIVQGPLVDAFGQPCAIGVMPWRRNDFSRLVVVENRGFGDDVIIVQPPFGHRGHPVVIEERPLAVPRQGFTTGSTGSFTTGPLGPFTTFSNSPPEPRHVPHHFGHIERR